MAHAIEIVCFRQALRSHIWTVLWAVAALELLTVYTDLTARHAFATMGAINYHSPYLSDKPSIIFTIYDEDQTAWRPCRR